MLLLVASLQEDRVADAASGPFLPGTKCTNVQVTLNANVDPHFDPNDADWTYIFWTVKGIVDGAFVLHGLGYYMPIEVRGTRHCIHATYKLHSWFASRVVYVSIGTPFVHYPTIVHNTIFANHLLIFGCP